MAYVTAHSHLAYGGFLRVNIPKCKDDSFSFDELVLSLIPFLLAFESFHFECGL